MKYLKYFLLIKFFNQNKQRLSTIFILIIGLIVSIYIFNDLIKAIDYKLDVLLLKWFVITCILAFIFYNIKKIIMNTKQKIQCKIPKFISNKAQDMELLTKGDLIKKKYKEIK